MNNDIELIHIKENKNDDLEINTKEIIKVEDIHKINKALHKKTAKGELRKINAVNSEIEGDQITKCNDIIFFNGKEYCSFSIYNNYKAIRKIKKTIFKCINVRKDDQFKRDTNQPVLYSATKDFIEIGQNVKSGYFIKSFHSTSCLELDYKKLNEKAKDNILQESDKEQFIKLGHEILNNSTIFDSRLFKEEFKNIYNKNKYNFPLNDNMLSNLINNWRKISDRFTKFCIFSNKFDYQNRLILRDYSNIPIEKYKKVTFVSFEYKIFGNNENISRMRKSMHLFIEGIFHHP